MDTPLQDKVVLVTGGARRVGAAIARMLHAAGARVAIHYRSSANEAHALQAELERLRPGSVALLQAELVAPQAPEQLIRGVQDAFGRLDVLINNASSYYPTELGCIDEASWEDLMGSNLKAPMLLSQAAAGELRRNRGVIVNITDMHVERPKKGYVVYSVAKAGLVALTRSLALELAPEVRVNAVAPGPVLWPENNAEFDDAYREKVVAQTLLKRLGEADDVARAVRYLVQDAPFVTGQVLAVDGGRSLSL